MQFHAAIGEHLAVQPVTTAVAFCQQRRNLVGNGADSGLQRRPGADETHGVPRDGAIDIRRCRIASRQRQRRVRRGHQDIDLVDVQRVAMLLPDAKSARICLRDFDDEQALRIGSRTP
ncbi:Uncharacterised protein [Mycobacteroides abscessus]|nr:Uncharacterised protein [Mycobacteroides abscessus]